MKISRGRLKEIIKEELENAAIEEVAAMPVLDQDAKNLTNSDMQFMINYFKEQLKKLDQEVEDLQNAAGPQLTRLDQSVEDLSDVAVMNRDKIKTIKYVLQKLLKIVKRNSQNQG